MDNRTPLKPGHIVEIFPHKKYVIDRQLGAGGFSLLYLAHAEESERYVALKELFPVSSGDLIINRTENGTIMAFDQLYGESFSMDEPYFRSIFEREIKLAQKASKTYDLTGKFIA